MPANCKECRYYMEYANATVGDCQRYPPTVVYDGRHDSYERVWPRMNGSEWCGEFRHGSKPLSAEERIANKHKK